MPTAGTPREFISTAQAAKQLGLSLGAVQQMVESGKLVAWKTAGGHRRIRQDSVDALLAQAQPSRTRGPRNAGEETDRFRVMVVEDDELLRHVYREALERWALPLDVRIFEHGLDALMAVGRQPPDLLITDLRMNGVNGFEMIRRLRDNPATLDIAIVVVSSLSAEEIEAEGGLPPDVVAYGKPVPFRELHGYVQALISLVRRQRVMASDIRADN
ncbi:response regulator [Azoarcus communis]|uniref:Excisionase n=1 Tax=Parazoarcus communis SWub3 = DSM 12120 TaxID=1121029 RepID=A0A323UV39_9RHOO|nr:response regulator [Parazoarcus communis]NMG50448.1 response regulator [Parazoarcus communis]NMG71899.1 response regulator [Parazoarcus communis SWub3 = DSM 12120]PZA16317.1 excisionase [Azoarcus communis] [Parazoarcus communis SWub3 = DSM 12120]